MVFLDVGNEQVFGCVLLLARGVQKDVEAREIPVPVDHALGLHGTQFDDEARSFYKFIDEILPPRAKCTLTLGKDSLRGRHSPESELADGQSSSVLQRTRCYHEPMFTVRWEAELLKRATRILQGSR